MYLESSILSYFSWLQQDFSFFNHTLINFYTQQILAVSENGFKVMSMLYLTPVMPLGPVCYMMGSTSMPLKEFAKSKIAALPLTTLYVFLGASTGTLVSHHRASSSDSVVTEGSGRDGLENVTLSPMWISFGIVCSIGSIALITIKMKKELNKVCMKRMLHFSWLLISFRMHFEICVYLRFFLYWQNLKT